jgi:hypothetical protein
MIITVLSETGCKDNYFFFPAKLFLSFFHPDTEIFIDYRTREAIKQTKISEYSREFHYLCLF